MKNIRVIFLFLGFVLFGFMSFSNEAHAFRDRCPRHQVKTELKAKLAKTRMFRGSIDDFNSYLGNHDRSQGEVLAFVEQDEIYVESQFKFSRVSIGGPYFCVSLDEVKSSFYAAPKIYMPTDYKRGSCVYNHILKHEKRHLQAVYDFHEDNTSAYRRYLGHIARDVPLFDPVTNEEEAAVVEQKIAEYFSKKYAEQVHKSMFELNKKQEAIDTMQEYIGVGKRIAKCDEEDQKKQNHKTFSTSSID